MNRFEGDGRNMLDALPQHVREETSPHRIRREMARLMCGWFDERGSSFHSRQGGTLWVILEHCDVNRIPHVVEGNSEQGYEIRRTR